MAYLCSSEICVNEVLPVRAIVMLCQAKKNQIRQLHGFEAAKKVFAQLMVNNWNRSYQEKEPLAGFLEIAGMRIVLYGSRELISSQARIDKEDAQQ